MNFRARMTRRVLIVLVLPPAATFCRNAESATDACQLTPVAVPADFRTIEPDTMRVKFAGVTRAEVGPDGRLFVLDGSGPVLFAVDTFGTTTVVVDRAGSGPGELQDPRAFAFDSRGHLWVASPNPPMISEFDRTGRHLRSLRYWRASMVSDMAFDEAGNLYLAYRVLNLRGGTGSVSALVIVDRLIFEADSVRGVTLDSIASSTLTQPPHFDAPIVEYSLASSRTGELVWTLTLAYQLRWLDVATGSQQTVLGCQDGVDNEKRLKKATIFEGGYTLITHDVGFAPDGSLYHLTANVRRDSTQRLDRFDPSGRLAESWLLPSRKKGGVYLSAALPTAEPGFFWGYDVGGYIYAIRVHR